MSALRITSTDAEVQDISNDIRSVMPGLVFTTGIDPAYAGYTGYSQPGQNFNSLFINGVAVVSFGQLVGMRDDAKAKGPYTWVMGTGGFPVPVSIAAAPAQAQPVSGAGLGPAQGASTNAFGTPFAPVTGTKNSIFDQIMTLASQGKQAAQ